MKFIETQRKDIDELAEMMNRAFFDDKREIDNKEILLSLFYMKDFQLWNIVENNQMIGFICVKILDREGWIELLFVDKYYQKNGLGTKCFDGLFIMYPNVMTWHVSVREGRDYVKNFYLTLGFKEDKTENSCIHLLMKI